MRSRMIPLAGLLLLAASPTLVRAADDKPALVVSFKSLDGLISDVKYIAELAGKEEEAKQTEKMLKNLLGDPKGLEGVDPKKPMGLYVRINEDDPKKSEGVLLLPISDEDAFLKLLKRQDKIKVDDKPTDGVYKVTAENSPVPIYFTFANKYVYATAPDKAALAKDRLIAPDKVLPGKTTSLAAVVLQIDQVPQKYRDMGVSIVTQQLAEAKKKDQPGETPAGKAFRLAAIDETAGLVKGILLDGVSLTASIDVDETAGELSVSSSFSAKPGSKLAEDFADLGNKKTLGASLVGSDSAFNTVFDLSLNEKLRKTLSDAVDEGVKKALAEAAEKGQKEAAEAVVKALLPTLKAGELDSGFDLRGPSSKGLYTLVMGVKVQEGGEIEKLVKDALKTLPAKDQDKVKLDFAKAGGVNIHRLTGDEKNMDENFKKAFGDSKEIYFAIRDDALLVGLGENALDDLKQVVAAKPTSGAPFQMELSMSRMTPLMVKDHPAAPDAAKKAFKDSKKDKFRIALEGGKALTVKISMDAPVVTFSALMAEAEQGSKPKDKDK